MMIRKSDRAARVAPPEPPFSEALAEFGRRQNPYFVRDALPHALAVKSYWLALQGTTGPLDHDDIGLSVFSQNNEDGILLYLFSRIGFGDRRSIEIGCNIDNTTAGIPEGNTLNLIVNFAFHGLIVDMEELHVSGLRHFFATCLATGHFHQARDLGDSGSCYSPLVVQAEVGPENINAIARGSGFEGDIDLLSIDIDGNDVHVIDALEAVSPRVLVVEVNTRLPLEVSSWAGAVPRWELDPSTTAFRQSSGSSLARMCEVVEARGYVFVGMNNILINAFFIRSDVFETSGLRRMTVADYTAHRFRPPESRVPAQKQPSSDA